MLRQMLERLRTGGTWTIAGLARELGTSPALVEAAIEELARRGYLLLVGGASQIPRPIGGCASGCATCSAAGSCVRGGHDHGNDRVWALLMR